MSITVKLRRGTTTQHSTFTGEEAEVTVDTTKDVVVVHDGVTAGGHPMAKASDLATVAFTGDYNDLTNLPSGTLLTTSDIGVTVQGYDADTVVDAAYVHTDNNYTTAEKSKLAGIAAGAEVNVNADWNAVSGAAQILNKPTAVSAFTNDAGYLTSYTESDPIYTASSWYTTTNNSTNWNTAYSWGNHATAGYLTSYTETDPVVGAINGLVKANGAGTISAAVAGTDYLAPSAIGTTVQAYDADLTTWAGKTAPSGTVVGDTDTQTLTNKNIQERVVSIADGTSITINADTTDLATQANTQAAGTLTINAPTGTPVNGQKLMLRLQSTNVQTFSWNSVFAGSTDLVLPTASSGSSKYDYVGFIYNSAAAKWQLIAKNFGF